MTNNKKDSDKNAKTNNQNTAFSLDNTIQILNCLDQNLDNKTVSQNFSIHPSTATPKKFYKKTQAKINLDLKINIRNLNNEQKVKFLGIALDSKLTLGPMMDELKERCNSRLNIIKYFSKNK
ncbi:hypothetical protein BpHYR1_034309 [Brachionus plicatilis]|uniref:Uncharacterized protein n=1 Tax=Brachionus plicatilis TaxID=10195 RepID=A0A3M7RV31_BRAPC|nr:hypothetical protein BpHYR1_034309 [Brachionus plicatilis]